MLHLIAKDVFFSGAMKAVRTFVVTLLFYIKEERTKNVQKSSCYCHSKDLSW